VRESDQHTHRAQPDEGDKAGGDRRVVLVDHRHRVETGRVHHEHDHENRHDGHLPRHHQHEYQTEKLSSQQHQDQAHTDE
jgi:hypothetical protein